MGIYYFYFIFAYREIPQGDFFFFLFHDSSSRLTRFAIVGNNVVQKPELEQRFSNGSHIILSSHLLRSYRSDGGKGDSKKFFVPFSKLSSGDGDGENFRTITPN
jgi:hypothetical protein